MADEIRAAVAAAAGYPARAARVLADAEDLSTSTSTGPVATWAAARSSASGELPVNAAWSRVPSGTGDQVNPGAV